MLQQGRLAVVCAFALSFLAVPATALAAPPPNDDFNTPTPLVIGFLYNGDNSEATATAPSESLSRGDSEVCNPDEPNQMDRTVWYRFTGTGRNVTVRTANTTVDTLLAVYAQSITPAPSHASLLGCSDDIDGTNNRQSLLTMPTIKGNTYFVQVGSFEDPDPPDPDAGSGGDFDVFATSFPPGNNRADARPLAAGSPLAGDNRGATTEQPGEDLLCEGADPAPMRKTVWSKFTVSAEGDAVITASGFDTVMQIYRGASTTPMACNDDGVTGQIGPSRLRLRLTPGQYFVQVGGWGPDSSARDGDLTTQFEFTPDLDLDNDGANRPADCNDRNPGMRPGSTDIPENGVDENCDGRDAARSDRDGDGFNAPQDCRDDSPAIRPNAPEIPGNGVDENCDGRDGKAPLTSATYDWSVAPNGLTLRQLKVRAPRGTRITVSCRGRRCFRRIRFTTRRSGNVNVLQRIAKKRRKRTNRSKLTLRLTQPNTVGKSLTLTFRRNKGTGEKKACLAPNSTRRVKCP